MPKVKKVGVVVDDLSASQLSYHIIKNINDHVEESDTDFVAFFQNSTASMLPMRFSSMCINEVWNFDGVAIATSVSTVLSISKTFSPKQKYFYVWDLEWCRAKGREFEYIIQAFNKDDIKLIARSKDYAKAIKNYCNRDVVGVVDNFNIKQLMDTINHE
ncbi:hypothetical protein CMI37_13655 [Candidatus Pacearchaeota archaeon]|nr:hypothetical protein [Candidatus Pacearchaeota archaeon]|tara:strand:+ start:440 stop:916 length:477 start_codon:yes stop_codon:yes gene_type:complete